MEAGLNNGQPPVDDGASGATASGDGPQAAAAAVAAAGIVSQPSRKRARSDDSVSNMTDSCDSAASGIKRIKVWYILALSSLYELRCQFVRHNGQFTFTRWILCHSASRSVSQLIKAIWTWKGLRIAKMNIYSF